MAYKLIVAAKALRDIDKATKYYFDIQRKLAKRFTKDLKDHLNYINNNPQHIQIRYDNIRVSHLKKFPYSIHFAIEQQTIIILAVFHMSEDEQKWLNI